jgi:hypothetical protein
MIFLGMPGAWDFCVTRFSPFLNSLGLAFKSKSHINISVDVMPTICRSFTGEID